MSVILSEAKSDFGTPMGSIGPQQSGNPGRCFLPGLRRVFASLRVTEKTEVAAVIKHHISSFGIRVSSFLFPFSSFQPND
jgi:hypothetical protein